MKQGFSLVELSIVLVILGLLVGGILSGQNLIKAAELRSVTSEIHQFQTAVNLFKGKYFALPGDMGNAGEFWGYADTSGGDGGCGAPLTNEGTGTETCDGNSNGSIDQDYEQFRFWQQLANAGLIPGEFTGVQGVNSLDHIPDVNAPRSKYSNGIWAAWDNFNPGGDTASFAYDYGNIYSLGSHWAGNRPVGRLMVAEELWNIDVKVDDGKPGKGRVILRYWDECSNAPTKISYDADYDLQNTSPHCALYLVDAI